MAGDLIGILASPRDEIRPFFALHQDAIRTRRPFDDRGASIFTFAQSISPIESHSLVGRALANAIYIYIGSSRNALIARSRRAQVTLVPEFSISLRPRLLHSTRLESSHGSAFQRETYDTS